MQNNDFIPAGAALLVIYRHYITMNGRAIALLGGMPYVRFTVLNGHITVSGTTSPAGNRMQLRGKCGRINSTALAAWLSRNLQGYGTYRIQEEYQVHNLNGEAPCYEIFFRKYQNQRTTNHADQN